MQRKFFHFFVPLLVFSSECNFIGVKAMVGYNVVEATENELPSVVCLKSVPIHNRPPIETVVCSGTLISLQHVVTAEHCFDNLVDVYLQVYVGSINLINAYKHYIMWWQSFDRWCRANRRNIILPKNDIAVLKLITEASVTNIPAVLSNRPHNFLGRLFVVCEGWGRSNNYSFPSSLLKANLNIVPNDECSRLIYKLTGVNIFINDAFICTNSKPYVHLEVGDSGGPLFNYNIIVGINLGISPNRELNGIFQPEAVNIHISIAYYRPFIEFHLMQ